MPRPRRLVESTANETLQPPAALKMHWMICRVDKAEGKNLYSVKNPKGESLLVELPARFRSTIWVKRGSFVVVDTAAFHDRENKLDGEVQNVVGDEKAWRKMPYWPVEFPKPKILPSDSDEEPNSKRDLPLDESDFSD